MPTAADGRQQRARNLRRSVWRGSSPQQTLRCTETLGWVWVGTVWGVDVEIRLLDDRREERRLHDVFEQVWGSRSLVGLDIIRAVGHTGGYVAAAYADDQIVGGSLGFLGRHLGEASLHSHLTGI